MNVGDIAYSVGWRDGDAHLVQGRVTKQLRLGGVNVRPHGGWKPSEIAFWSTTPEDALDTSLATWTWARDRDRDILAESEANYERFRLNVQRDANDKCGRSPLDLCRFHERDVASAKARLADSESRVARILALKEANTAPAPTAPMILTREAALSAAVANANGAT